jgi:CheY-like chemotaxis protein
MSPHNHVNLLVVEDNEVDREALRRAFKRHGVHQPMIDVDDGVEALAVLRGERDLPLGRPYLILLDLNMPRMSGLEFLSHIKADPVFSQIPVVIVSTEGKEEDTQRGLEAGAAAYVTKPFQREDIVEVINRLTKS